MKTKRQEELISSFLSQISEDSRPVYTELVLYLSQLGYHPQKERAYILFKHDQHNKQMAKMGMKKGENPTPFFSLRFSACTGYSQRFLNIVRDAVSSNHFKEAMCVNKQCNFCQGEPSTHVYTYTFDDGVSKFHCGAYALEVPSITFADADEIKKLIKEEHEYLLRHEAGVL